jgi:endoglucanase
MRTVLVLGNLGALVALLACVGGCGHNGSHRLGSAASQSNAEPGDPAHNLLKQSTFTDGSMLPWNTSFSEPANGEAHVKDGALCVHVEQGGSNRWDAQIRHREMIIEKGHDYTLSFKAWASRKTNATTKVGMAGPPYFDYLTKKIELTNQPRQFAYAFKMNQADDATAEFALHFGGQMIQGPGPIDLCFDDMILSDAAFTPPPPPPKVVLPGVRVNQIGYLPKFEKVAVAVANDRQPVDFTLLDAQGKSVFQGKTRVIGPDAASGDSVHLLDFTAFTNTGKGYVLEVGSSKSDPFRIDSGIYGKLKYDALKYFYLDRSGTPIDKAFAPDPSVARAAGHARDLAACAPNIGCNYTLDVTGGWYDAGDYGKYVVNGGISVWTLMNWYERAKFMSGDQAAFGDLKGFIPESQNRIPDILDEARWELEFFLRMQVPEGKPNAGMVHHKIHDVGWTALGIAPGDSKMERTLHAVSTAATLNVAATLAQAARIWKDFDPKFSAACLQAAERAWKAAEAYPNKLALKADTNGGGPYDDDQLVDEFYWAAAELFITTGQDVYKQHIDASALDAELSDGMTGGDGTPTAMTWQVVDALGKISLAIVPSKITAEQRNRYRAQIEKVAKSYQAITEQQGYRLPFAPNKANKYPWGSNSFVLNNALVMAVAHDFNKDPQLLTAVAQGMDYILGRNALAQSYVTGYGTRPLKHPHHRFWANQVDARFPVAPPGIVSGGPNSDLQDPYVKAAGLTQCAPEKCFVDNAEAWSTNEITINWNAPLVWVTAWLDEHAK